MTSILVAAAGIVALVGGSVGTRWLVHWWHQENHAQHAAGAVVPARLPERDFYGSMSREDELRLTGWTCEGCGGGPIYGGTPPWCYGCGPNATKGRWIPAVPLRGLDGALPSTTFLPAPADPVPWEDLQSDARIEDDHDGDQTAAWFRELREDPGPGMGRPPPPGPVQEPPEAGRASRGMSGETACVPTLAGCSSERGVHATPTTRPPELTRLADTDDIAQARGWPTVRDQDADVADWLAGRAVTWARLTIAEAVA